MRLFPYPSAPLDTIGNVTRQTRQHVSSHQQPNVCVDGPRWGVKLCVMQSARVHKWASGSESPYQWCFIEWFTCWHLIMAQHWNPQQFAEGLHFCHIERFSSVVVGPVLVGTFSGHSDVGDSMFYRIPNIHGALLKWSYGKITNVSLPWRCCASSLVRWL